MLRKTDRIRRYFGPTKQVAKTVEELTELLTELARSVTKERDNRQEIINELADSMIMILQMWHVYGFNKCKYQMQKKLYHIENEIFRLENHDNLVASRFEEDNIGLGE